MHVRVPVVCAFGLIAVHVRVPVVWTFVSRATRVLTVWGGTSVPYVCDTFRVRGRAEGN